MADDFTYYKLRETKATPAELNKLIERHQKCIEVYNKNVTMYNEYEMKDARFNRCLVQLREQVELIRSNLETGNYDFDHKRFIEDFVKALKSGIDENKQIDLITRGENVLWIAAALSVDHKRLNRLKALKKEQAEKTGKYHYTTMDDEPNRD